MEQQIKDALSIKDLEKVKSLLSLVDVRSYTFSFNEKIGDTIDDYRFTRDHLTILHLIACYDFVECFEYYLTNSELSIRQTYYNNIYLPLHYACWFGSKSVALYILNNDPEEALLCPNENDLSLLYCAVVGGNYEIIQELLKRGAKYSSPNDYKGVKYGRLCHLVSRAKETNKPDIITLLSKYIPLVEHLSRQNSPIMTEFIKHNMNVIPNLYQGVEDITYYVYRKNGYVSIISLLADYFTHYRQMKDFVLKVLNDAKDLTIEPPDESEFEQDGVCYWACRFCDVDIARALLKTQNVQINRFNRDFQTGARALSTKKSKEACDVLEVLIENGLDINIRYNNQYPTLLQTYIDSINPNYDLIRTAVKFGADIYAFHSLHKDNDRPITLLDDVRRRKKEKIEKIFNEALE